MEDGEQKRIEINLNEHGKLLFLLMNSDREYLIELSVKFPQLKKIIYYLIEIS